MNLKKLITNIVLLSISILFGTLVLEFTGRTIGLGNPLLYKEDKLIGYRLRPNQSKVRLKNTAVNTDFEGFRFDPNKKQDPNAKIIIFVGDSVTYGGSYIDDTELFSIAYCSKNRKLVCLNSGVNGWGTDNMGRFIANFSLYSDRIPSKFILIILPGDDLRNLSQLRGLPYWTSPPKQPKAINELFNYVFLRYILLGLRTETPEEKQVNPTDQKIEARTIEIAWNDLNNYIRSSKFKVDVVLTPPKVWFEKSKKNLSNIKLYDDYLITLEENPNVLSTCNLYYFIKEDYSPTDYVDRVHLSKKGHMKWTKYLRSCLNE